MARSACLLVGYDARMLRRATTAPTHETAQLAPEPHFSAYHHLIYAVAIFMRSRPQISGDQWFALGDAIHNVPEFLIRHDGYRQYAARHGTTADAEFRLLFLEPYDRRWVRSDDDFSLLRALDDGYRRFAEAGAPAVTPTSPKRWWQLWR